MQRGMLQDRLAVRVITAVVAGADEDVVGRSCSGQLGQDLPQQCLGAGRRRTDGTREDDQQLGAAPQSHRRKEGLEACRQASRQSAFRASPRSSSMPCRRPKVKPF